MNTNEWIARHAELVSAIKSGCAALAAHMGRLPDPRSADETESLLQWRYQTFRLPFSPADDAAIGRAAPAAGEMLEEARGDVVRAARELLQSAEGTFALDARANRFGLFSPDSLPAEAVRVRGEYAYAIVAALPIDHPLRSLGPTEALPEVCLGIAKFVTSIFNGNGRYVLAPWQLVSIIREEVEGQLADRARRSEMEKEAAQEHERALAQREEAALPAAERRLRRLEEQLAELKSSAKPS
jgi:hypothetical protein